VSRPQQAADAFAFAFLLLLMIIIKNVKILNGYKLLGIIIYPPLKRTVFEKDFKVLRNIPQCRLMTS